MFRRKTEVLTVMTEELKRLHVQTEVAPARSCCRSAACPWAYHRRTGRCRRASWAPRDSRNARINTLADISAHHSRSARINTFPDIRAHHSRSARIISVLDISAHHSRSARINTVLDISA